MHQDRFVFGHHNNYTCTLLCSFRQANVLTLNDRIKKYHLKAYGIKYYAVVNFRISRLSNNS